MKKFLSVLLALAVAFTFTFGSTMSAFAADSYYKVGGANFATAEKAEAAYLADINAAEEVVLTALKSNYDIAKIKVTQKGEEASTVLGAPTAEIAASYWLAQLDIEYNDVKADVLSKTRALKSANYEAEDVAKVTAADYRTVTKDDDALVSGVYGTEKYAYAALKAGFADYQADAVAKINSVNTSIYSETTYTEEKHPMNTSGESPVEGYNWAYPTGPSTTKTVYNAKTVADETLKYAVSLVNAKTIAVTDEDTADLKDVYDAVDNIVANYTVAGYAADGKTYAFTFKANAAGLYPYTKAAETTENANNSANIAKAKADLEAKIAIAVAGAESLTPAQRALWDTVLAAFKEVETAKIDGSLPTVGTFPTSVTYNTAVTEVAGDENALAYLAKVALVDKYEAKAANLKAAKNADGSVAYDAAKIDTLLATYVKKVYVGLLSTDPTDSQFSTAKLDSVTVYDKNEYKATITNLMNADTYSHKISINGTTYAITEASDAAEYYAKEWADVEAAVDAYKAAIDAAATNADVTAAAKALKTALDAIKVKGSIVYDAATRKAVDDAEEMAAAYVLTINAGKAAADKVPAAPADLTEWFKENGARTAADVVALYDTLKAELAGKLSENAMKAAVKALQDQIDALPASLTVTAADADQIIAARDAFNAFAEKYITNADINGINNVNDPYATGDRFYSTTYRVDATALGKAYNALLAIKQKEITDAEKAIAKGDCTAVTVADKEAVNNVLALQEAYKELTEAYYTAGIVGNYNAKTWVAKALETIRDLEAKAIVNAIAALPTDITADNKEAVEAARKAYDAFVAEYTFYDNKNIYGYAFDAVSVLAAAPYNVNLAKLEAAEATIAIVSEYTDVNVKADLFDMSRTLSIWKTTKTSLKVTVKGSVKNITDNGYTVKYKFYKKGPGASKYTLIKTSTSKVYTYKNLKKGTNKFQVKVCVYDADGKLVASKWTYYRSIKVK